MTEEGDAKSLVSKAAWACGIFLVMYVLHAYLQYQYYIRCTSNIIRVILMQRSDMCVQLHGFLTAIEVLYSKDILQLLSRSTGSIPTLAALFA